MLMMKMPDASTPSAAAMPESSAALTTGVKAAATASLPLESGVGT